MTDMTTMGLTIGFLVKAASSHLVGEPLLSRPWAYPKYMVIGAVALSYFDWQRRLWQETLLNAEDKLVKQSFYLNVDLMHLGEELQPQNKQQLKTFAVEQHQI